VLDADVVAEELRWLAASAGDQGFLLVQFQSEGLPEELRQPGLDLLGFGLRPINPSMWSSAYLVYFSRRYPGSIGSP
jgi:hypothetical protein